MNDYKINNLVSGCLGYPNIEENVEMACMVTLKKDNLEQST